MTLDVLTEPLNPALFERLRCQFGTVLVFDPGQPRRVADFPDPRRPGKLRAVVQDEGEQYRIDCPFCDDQLQSLWISYAYGHRDPVTGRDNYQRWHCQNKECHKDVKNSELLRDYTAIPFSYFARQLAVNASGEHLSNSPLITAPVPTLPYGLLVEALREDHPAAAYLLARGLHPITVAGWGVGYCHHSVELPDASGRIIVPILGLSTCKYLRSYQSLPQFTLVGWQALAVGDPQDGQPAWVNSAGLDLTKHVYGLEKEIYTFGPIFVCESVTDCWRIGRAVANFSKTLSEYQQLLLTHHFEGRPIIVVMGSSARAEAKQIQLQLQRARCLSDGDRRVFVLDLPCGRNDPSECSLAEIIDAAVQAMGRFKVSPWSMSPEMDVPELEDSSDD